MKLPFTMPEWRAYPIQEKLLGEIEKHEYQVQDCFAVDPQKVKRLKILNAYKRKDKIRVYYQVWYDLMEEPFESIGLLVYRGCDEVR